mmetsp:Transcript_38031/g.63829  ORF Transcript_38031/g.63829 Transcript_38031/m.63829 type:complete len:306 (+) Transcript_38031:541-1458(+)
MPPQPSGHVPLLSLATYEGIEQVCVRWEGGQGRRQGVPEYARGGRIHDFMKPDHPYARHLEPFMLKAPFDDYVCVQGWRPCSPPPTILHLLVRHDDSAEHVLFENSHPFLKPPSKILHPGKADRETSAWRHLDVAVRALLALADGDTPDVVRPGIVIRIVPLALEDRRPRARGVSDQLEESLLRLDEGRRLHGLLEFLEAGLFELEEGRLHDDAGCGSWLAEVEQLDLGKAPEQQRSVALALLRQLRGHDQGFLIDPASLFVLGVQLLQLCVRIPEPQVHLVGLEEPLSYLLSLSIAVLRLEGHV